MELKVIFVQVNNICRSTI